MNKVNSVNLYTDRLDLRIPTIVEQYDLWKILINEDVNKYYFPTPDRIFVKNNLNKEDIEDLKKARKIFIEQLSDWERQLPFYEKKIRSIELQEDNQKFTWSIFLKDTDIVIGQITCQPKDNEPEYIRDVGWFINPKYQGNGYASEAAYAMLDFMFNEVGITDIYTSAAEINPGSWKIMEKLGFEFFGNKKSTYFKDDEILVSREYHGNKELFLNSVKSKRYK
ncbi:MAG: GNAT family N-acetyltransferase [Firmicutes bacterium]|nr:GNAT family N-acetyltransferase [Bacillota bacterium]